MTALMILFFTGIFAEPLHDVMSFPREQFRWVSHHDDCRPNKTPWNHNFANSW